VNLLRASESSVFDAEKQTLNVRRDPWVTLTPVPIRTHYFANLLRIHPDDFHTRKNRPLPRARFGEDSFSKKLARIMHAPRKTHDTVSIKG
jgi:hypothetical protein